VHDFPSITWLPTSTWITLSSVEGSRCSKCFSHWRSSCWAHGSTSNGSMSLSCSAWLINVMLAKIFLKTIPHWYQSPNWTSLMITMVGTCQTLILIEEAEWRFLTPCVCGHNSWLVFLPARRVAKVCAALYRISNDHYDLSCSPFFHHAVCWLRVMKELQGSQVIIRFSGCHGLSLASAEYNWWLVPLSRRDNEDRPFIVLYKHACDPWDG